MVDSFTRLGATSALLLAFAACGGTDGVVDPGPEPDPPGTIDSSGGTVASSDGIASLSIPSGALGSKVTITALTSALGAPNANLMLNTTYRFRPTATQFSTPAQLTLKYQDYELIDMLPESALFIAEELAGKWVAVESGSVVDPVTRTVTAMISNLGNYGIVVDACVTRDVNLDSSFGGRIREGDCLLEVGGIDRREDFFKVSLTEPSAIRMIMSTDDFTPEVGLKASVGDVRAGQIYGARAGETGLRVTPSLDMLLPAGDYTIFAANRDGESNGAYSVILGTRSGEHDLTCRGIFVLPPYSGAQAIDSGDCEIQIAVSPVPEAVGKTTYEEYYNVNLNQGQKLTVTVQKTGGEDAFAPFPTIFYTGGVAQIDNPGAALDAPRTVEYTADTDGYVTLGVSSILKGEGGDLVATTGTYSLSITIN